MDSLSVMSCLETAWPWLRPQLGLGSASFSWHADRVLGPQQPVTSATAYFGRKVAYLKDQLNQLSAVRS